MSDAVEVVLNARFTTDGIRLLVQNSRAVAMLSLRATLWSVVAGMSIGGRALLRRIGVDMHFLKFVCAHNSAFIGVCDDV